MELLPRTCHEFFRSFFLQNTYLPPVNLSEQALSQHVIEHDKLFKLLSIKEVREVFSEPIAYGQKEIDARVRKLELEEFIPLAKRTTALEHSQVKGWVIKLTSQRTQEGSFVICSESPETNECSFFSGEEGLMRIAMADRIKQIANRADIEVVVPEKKLVAYQDEPKKYALLSKKLPLLSREDTLKKINSMSQNSQIELGKKIAYLVENSGLTDATFLINIGLTKEGKLAFYDTEPGGAMVAKECWCLQKRGASVEKCARVGLSTLYRSLNDEGLVNVSLGVLPRYQSCVVNTQISNWRIALAAASLGVYAVVVLVLSIAYSIFTYWLVFTINKLNEWILLEPNLGRKLWYRDLKLLLARSYFRTTEGVPKIV